MDAQARLDECLTEMQAVAPRRVRRPLRGAARYVIHPLLFILGCAIGASLMRSFGVPFYLRYFVHNNLTDGEILEMRRWQSEPVDLPPGALDVKQFTPEMAEAATEFRRQWKKLEPKVSMFLVRKATAARFKEVRPMLMARRRELARMGVPVKPLIEGLPPRTFDDLAPLLPLLAAFERVVRCDGYGIMAFHAETAGAMTDPAAPDADEAIRATGRVIAQRVMIEAGEGRRDDALAALRLIFDAASAERFDGMSLAAIRLERGAAGAARDYLRTDPPPEQLREIIALLERPLNRPPLFQATHFNVEWCIGTLREARRRGIAVPLKPLTASRLWAASTQALSTINDWRRSARYPEPEGRQVQLESLRAMPAGIALLNGEWRESEGIQKGILAPEACVTVFYAAHCGCIPYSTTKVHEKVARAWIGLTLIEAATALYRAEHGGEPPDLQALVPECLPALPVDPYSRTQSTFIDVYRPHSLGPDHIEQWCNVVYDPTNGLESRGDLYLADPEP